jgi:cytochrome c2
MAQTQTASAEAGAQIASNVCAQCHKLPTGQGANVGPAFSEMAQQGPYQAADIARIMQQGQHAAARAQTEAADYPKLAEYLNSLR